MREKERERERERRRERESEREGERKIEREGERKNQRERERERERKGGWGHFPNSGTQMKRYHQQQRHQQHSITNNKQFHKMDIL